MSAVPKLPVLIDVDGVLADFVGPILRAAGSYLEHHQVTEYEMFDHHMDEAERARAIVACGGEDFWENLPVIQGAQEGVEEIRAHRPVVFLTQPWHGCSGWYGARLAWLRRHFAASHRELAPLHGSVKHLVDGAALIEDSPVNLTAWSDAHPHRMPVIFDAPYNRTLTIDRPLWLLKGWSTETTRVLMETL